MHGHLSATMLCCTMLAAGAGHAAAQPDPSGVWMRGDGNARVRIAPCGGDWCATNLWIRDTSGGEAVGDKLVMTVKPASETTLKGKAFDPKRDLTYSITIKVARSSLSTRGCIIGGVVCKTVSWSRTK